MYLAVVLLLSIVASHSCTAVCASAKALLKNHYIIRGLLCTALLFSFFIVSAQGNLIFSLPYEYDFKVSIPGYNSTKPQTWQTKFENLPAGEYRITIFVTKPNSTYQKQEIVNIRADRGYETTYFIIPFENALWCRLANYYTIEQVYGQNNTNSNNAGSNNSTGTSTSRADIYNNKPVLNNRDLADFITAAKSRYSSSDKMSFFKNQLPKFYSYTDDIISFLSQFYAEAEKLDLAKFAYDYVIDKQLYSNWQSRFIAQAITQNWKIMFQKRGNGVYKGTATENE